MAFSKILIANRGEIACRIIRTAQGMGYQTVAVYSDVDANALHVAMSDEAVHIGSASVIESYLNINKILQAAAVTGADAVHPGYGFLAENGTFAEACIKSGLVFIGPSPASITIMGNKRLAKLRMADAGVQSIPGYSGADQDEATIRSEGEKLGFPLMVKAAAGGGGKGMRLVLQSKDLPAAISGAKSEAENAFGSSELILEKALIKPRHIEIQIFADSQGNCIYLGERDCSIQRRHQKIVEESPSPAVSSALRADMGKSAVDVAKAINYLGAGTVEYLLGSDGSFYFLEMNTRLQVEHPVTEMVTGLDLVAWQLAVASGESLPLTQDEVKIEGHAIETRIYAEDPYLDFLPQTGLIAAWKPSPELRVDTGITEGQEITPFYDPMIAKIISHGKNREECRRKLLRGLEDTTLLGLRNNKSFLMDLLRTNEFIDGKVTTAFISDFFPNLVRPKLDHLYCALAAILIYRRGAKYKNGWSSALPILTCIDLRCDERKFICQVAPCDTSFEVTVASDRSLIIELLRLEAGRVYFRHQGVSKWASYAFEDDNLYLELAGCANRFYEFTSALASVKDQEGDGRLIAPMAGRIVSIKAAVGQSVKRGQILVILEAMKMEHEIKASSDGVVEIISVAEGDQVEPRKALVVVGKHEPLNTK